MVQAVDDSDKKDQDGNILAQNLAKLCLEQEQQNTVVTGKENIEGKTFG